MNDNEIEDQLAEIIHLMTDCPWQDAEAAASEIMRQFNVESR